MSLRRRSYLFEAARAKKGKFEIELWREKHEVTGYIVGHFGIDKRREWMITHLPSRLSLGTGFRTLKVAKKYAEEMVKFIPKSADRMTAEIADLAKGYRDYLQGGGNKAFKQWKKEAA